MAQTPEGRLQKKIKEALIKEFPFSFWFKSHGGPYQTKGIPDLIGCVNGIYVGIEVKVPGKEKTLTKIQKHTIGQIMTAGGIAFMSTSAEHAIATIKSELERR
jgi:Holliday junction resolvase